MCKKVVEVVRVVQVECPFCKNTHPGKLPMQRGHLKYNLTTILVICSKTGKRFEADFGEAAQ
jgi:hypothetical protein